jgi:glyoxylase-like metal-dependent hydrolase (beta-lactamase superfamily II)
MYFRQILHEDHSCASYLVGCPTLGLCAVVDPQGDPQRYIEEVENNGMVISAVIDTHVHADHVSSARDVAEAAGATLFLGPNADVRFEHHELSDDQILEIGNRKIRVLHTPGHTPEHISLLVDEWFVLPGDTLFVGDVGRVDLAHEGDAPDINGRANQLHRSLQRLLALPDWIEVYPGHYAGSVCGRGMDGKTISTIGRERRKNRALQMEADEFLRFQHESLPPLPDDFKTIKRRNIGAREP